MKTFKEYLAEIELAKKKITTVHNPPPGSLRVRVMETILTVEDQLSAQSIIQGFGVSDTSSLQYSRLGI
jgi:hypothetical protein